MEQKADYTELEDMRRQMAVLKEKLAAEEILTDRLLRRTMQSQVRRINRKANMQVVAGVLVLTAGNFVWRELGMSPAFMVATSIMMLVMIIMSIAIHSRLHEADVRDGDLLSVARHARLLKQHYRRWRQIGIPITMAWLAWLTYEIMMNATDTQSGLITMTPIIVGGIAGGIIGWYGHRMVQQSLDDIIEQIEE